MAALDAFDLDDLADCLADQQSYEVRHLVHRRSGEMGIWTEYGGVDGETRIDLEEIDPDLVVIEPIPSREWYLDMAEFAAVLSDGRAAGHLEIALEGKGAFRRFRAVVMDRHPDLETPWQEFRRVRARRRAARWLADEGLVDRDEVEAYAADHPDPPVP